MVLQDTNLFTGTVMENIRYGRLDATDEECMAAAELAGAHDFITRLPQGYDTPLSGNGASLSQGQRQLLSIARAAVADPPVMILDEATSSIDTRTEAIVQRGMDALMTNRTVFVIAHRLSTVQNSNAIMVLDHGRIIERGTHDELIALKGHLLSALHRRARAGLTPHFRTDTRRASSRRRKPFLSALQRLRLYSFPASAAVVPAYSGGQHRLSLRFSTR